MNPLKREYFRELQGHENQSSTLEKIYWSVKRSTVTSARNYINHVVRRPLSDMFFYSIYFAVKERLE